MFVDFMAFYYFTQTYFTLMLTKKLQLPPLPGRHVTLITPLLG